MTRQDGKLLWRVLLSALLLLGGGSAFATGASGEAPRVVAALEQGAAAEAGIGGIRRPALAMALYCGAGVMGSAEGFYRVGRLLRERHYTLHNPALANAYLALAARLGHHQAQAAHDPLQPAAAPLPDDCSEFSRQQDEVAFDIKGYLAILPQAKQNIAALISRHAPRFNVDERFALAVALAESNLDHLAVSPKNAQGVMQLIPETQERFGVSRPFDPESNIRGALTYLRWLMVRFDGDLALVAAAYNAGEGMVDKYRGIPPFPETQQYVRRVFHFSGIPFPPTESKPSSMRRYR